MQASCHALDCVVVLPQDYDAFLPQEISHDVPQDLDAFLPQEFSHDVPQDFHACLPQEFVRAHANAPAHVHPQVRVGEFCFCQDEVGQRLRIPTKNPGCPQVLAQGRPRPCQLVVLPPPPQALYLRIQSPNRNCLWLRRT